MYIPCIELYRQHHAVFYQEFKKMNHAKKCTNKETVGGYPVDEFREHDLYAIKEGKKTYCLRKDQMKFLSINPYTMKSLPLLYHTKVSIPISVLLDFQLCPVRPISTSLSDHPIKQLILISPTPISKKSELPVKISIGNKHDENKKIQIVEYVDPIKIYTGYYYIIHLKDPIPKTEFQNRKFVYRKDIRDMSPLYQKEMIIAYRQNQRFDSDIKTELKAFFNYRSKSFSSDIIDFFRTIRIVPKHSVKCFRGLLIHSKKKLEDLNLSHIQVGDTIRLDSRKFPMSWSTDSCVSSYFATHEAAMRSSDNSNIMFGILLSTRINPDDILLDSRMISPKYFVKQVYSRYQDEVITFPTDLENKPIVFECKIERLFLINSISRYFTIVRRFDNFLDDNHPVSIS